MNPVIRRFPFTHAPGAGAAMTCTAQGTEVHWVPSGRAAHEIVAGVASIHMVWDGGYGFGVDERTLRLDDEVFLVLNAGHVLTGRGRREANASLLSVFFAPELVRDAFASARADACVLRGARAEDGQLRFFEHLRDRDRCIAPVMRYIAHHIERGVEDQLWYEEQIAFLLERLLTNEARLLERVQSLACKKPWRRRETFQRLARVTDLIHSSYERQLTMAELAATAHWSPFHMMREFKAAYGVSPYEYLQRRRTQAALHLLASTQLPVAVVAESVGFSERSTLIRRLRREHGLAPRALRTKSQQCSPQRLTIAASVGVNSATT